MTGFTVFSKRIAHELTLRGFKIIGTGLNDAKPWLYVYYFEDTPDFQKALKEVTQRGGSHG